MSRIHKTHKSKQQHHPNATQTMPLPKVERAATTTTTETRTAGRVTAGSPGLRPSCCAADPSRPTIRYAAAAAAVALTVVTAVVIVFCGADVELL